MTPGKLKGARERALMNILHTSDWHLRDRDIEEAEKCLKHLADTAMTEAVDLAVISGDIFDSQEVRLDSRAAKLAVKAVSALADTCPVAIIIGTPSHDGRAPDILAYVRGRHRVHVAAVPGQVEMAGAVLTLIPQPTKQYFQSEGGIQRGDLAIGAAMSHLFAGFGAKAAGKRPHILVYHGGVSGARLPNGHVPIGMEIEVSTDQLMLANPDLGCLGHLHLRQQIGDRFFYAGPIYATKIDETGPNGFWIHDLDIHRPNPWVWKFIETPGKKIVRLEHDFTIEGSIKDLDIVLYAIHHEDIKGAFIRLDFKAWQDEAAQLDREKIREFYLSVGALDVDLRIVRVPRQTVRSAEVLRVDRLRDKLRAMAGLRGEEVSETVLSKADALEDRSAEELLGEVAR